MVDTGKAEVRKRRTHIFISYASEEAEIANLLYEHILVGALNIPRSLVYLTASDETGLEHGEHFVDQLRDRFPKTALMIMLLSASYYDSEICMNEMGAAWATKIPRMFFLIPPTTYNDMKGVFPPQMHTGKINDIKTLEALPKKIKARTSIRINEDVGLWNKHSAIFLEKVQPEIDKPRPGRKVSRDLYLSVSSDLEVANDNFNKVVFTFADCDISDAIRNAMGITRPDVIVRDEHVDWLAAELEKARAEAAYWQWEFDVIDSKRKLDLPKPEGVGMIAGGAFEIVDGAKKQMEQRIKELEEETRSEKEGSSSKEKIISIIKQYTLQRNWIAVSNMLGIPIDDLIGKGERTIADRIEADSRLIELGFREMLSQISFDATTLQAEFEQAVYIARKTLEDVPYYLRRMLFFHFAGKSVVDDKTPHEDVDDAVERYYIINTQTVRGYVMYVGSRMLEEQLALVGDLIEFVHERMTDEIARAFRIAFRFSPDTRSIRFWKVLLSMHD